MLTAFIMAGGRGERFWPLSTETRPKQLLNLITDKSMIFETVERILPLIPASHIFIGTNLLQAEAIRSELPFIPSDNIIIEPEFKDTAAAIGYGALIIETKYPSATMVVLASDHLIKDPDNFLIQLKTAVELAKNDVIVTLGIKPNRPETGYGYIEVDNFNIGKPTKAIRFWEKPSYERALEYVESGNFLWNSGMFIFTTTTLFIALEKHVPKHYGILQEIKKVINYQNKVKTLFTQFEKISIDFAVMEKADNIIVIPVSFGWNDIGTFTALEEVFPSDIDGNVIKNADIITLEANNNIIIGENDKKIIALLGIEDLVIVDTKEALLISHKDSSQKIKKLVDMLKNKE